VVIHTDNAVRRVPQATFVVSVLPFFPDDATWLSFGSAAPIIV
jgi:hypothetical protein